LPKFHGGGPALAPRSHPSEKVEEISPNSGHTENPRRAEDGFRPMEGENPHFGRQKGKARGTGGQECKHIAKVIVIASPLSAARGSCPPAGPGFHQVGVLSPASSGQPELGVLIINPRKCLPPRESSQRCQSEEACIGFQVSKES
jgi:hypothetical protein